MTQDPAPADAARTPAEILYAEHLARLAAGERVELDDLCARHPQHETALRVLALAHGPEPEAVASRFESVIRERLSGDGPQAPAPGGRAERYTIRREIARGGMGVVYEAWDEDLGRALAMKVTQGSAGLERFLDEARITGRLDHPGVLPVHELGLDADGRAFFTMPLIEGSDLETILRNAISGKEGWSLTRALEVLVKVCDTLAYAHSRGVIHRDLKPKNVMVGRFGETYVMDWGLARVLGEAAERSQTPADAGDAGAASSPHRTLAGTVLGTPAYMPPEQAGGNLAALDERSDVYAVGGMLYTLLTGQRPYASSGSGKSSREVVASVLAGPPARIQELNRAATPELVAICERAMARSKEARYASMMDLADDLRAFLERRVVRAYRTGALAELQKWVARNRTMAAAAMVALLGLAGFLSWRELTRRELEEERNRKGQALVSAQSALAEREIALRRSEANRLTALAVAQLPDDPSLSLLLAIEGATRAPGPVANTALLSALGSVREQRTLEVYRGWVSGVSFDPSGTRIVTASQDGGASVWDVASGEERLRMAAGEPLNWASFDPSGSNVFAAGRASKKVYVWDARSGALLRILSFSSPLGDLRWAPRGEWLLAATDDGRVSFLDPRTLTLATHLRVRAQGATDTRVLAAELHPDGERLLAVGPDLVASIWSLSTREPTGLTILDCTVARFSTDGRNLVVGSPDGDAHVLDAVSGQARVELTGHRDRVEDIAFSPGGRCVLTASRDGTARLWDLWTGKALAVLSSHTSDVLSVAAGRDGRLLATASDDGTARLWGASVPLAAASTPDALPAGPAPISASGRRALHPRDRDVEVWEPESGRQIQILSGHAGIVRVATCSPDGRLAATGTTNTADGVRVWDLESARMVATFRGHVGGILSAAFDPGGQRIISTSAEDLSARIFEARTGELLVALPGHAVSVPCAAFSEDGKRAVTGSHDGNVRVWDATTGKLQWQERALERVQCVGFFAGDTIVISGTYRDSVQILDAATGKSLARLGGRSGTVLQVAYHAEKGLVATRSSDTTMRVWSASTREEALVIPAAERGFRHLAFSADGARLYTLAGEHEVRAWPLEPLAAAAATRPRALTPHEQHRFEIGPLAERERYRKSWRVELLRRDLDVAGRAVAQRPHDWRIRDHYLELLKASWQQLAALGERAELTRLAQLLRQAAADSMADGTHLSRIAETQRLVGHRLDALETLERAVRAPLAGEQAQRELADVRASFLPDLLTFDSIDSALESQEETLVAPGAAWRFFRGRREPAPGLEWATAELDDSAWEEGASGFGYEEDSQPVAAAGGAPATIGTLLNDMNGAYSTVYARRRVVLEEPERLRRLTLSIRADDGFVAYVDGTEVGRERAGPAGARLSFDAVADGPAREPPTAREIRFPVPAAGSFVVAVQGLNRARSNTDFLLLPELRGELRAGKAAARRGRKLLDAVRGSSHPGAAARAAYLEGRLLVEAGKAVEAIARFEAAASALEPSSRRPEPYLRLAECLEATGRAAEAEERLRAALQLGLEENERLWDRWLAICFGPLALEASAALSRLPPTTPQGDPSGRGALLRTLLESLSAVGAVRIRCGGEEHVSLDGSRWLADAFFTGGFRHFGDRHGAATAPFAGEIQGTEDDPLFRTERWFPWQEGRVDGYTIPLPRGRWRIDLHFAEIHCRESCRRKFDVLVEGRVVATDFEPGAVGYATPSRVTHEIEVVDGQLEVQLPARQGVMQPKISAIEVRRVETIGR